MRSNSFAARCRGCGQPVAPHEGELIKRSGVWCVFHSGCAAEDRLRESDDLVDQIFNDHDHSARMNHGSEQLCFDDI